jgi:hypothetical protein
VFCSNIARKRNKKGPQEEDFPENPTPFWPAIATSMESRTLAAGVGDSRLSFEGNNDTRREKSETMGHEDRREREGNTIDRAG